MSAGWHSIDLLPGDTLEVAADGEGRLTLEWGHSGVRYWADLSDGLRLRVIDAETIEVCGRPETIPAEWLAAREEAPCV